MSERSNPVAPAGYARQESEDNKPQLSNADFRELLKTPARGKSGDGFAAPAPKVSTERRDKKKAYSEFYKQKKQEEDDLKKRYRDRAAERREMEDRGELDMDDYLQMALATPTPHVLAAGQLQYLSEKQRLAEIEKTKYLGGDMEHTHLVKGLDYALLQKIKSETKRKTADDEEGEETKKAKAVKEVVELRTAMAKRIYSILFEQQENKRNDLFLPGRMAYKFTVQSEYGESAGDMPTTMLRSKVEIMQKQGIGQGTQHATNEIVVNKLMQIFAAVRVGARAAKGKDKDKKKRESANGGAPEAPKVRPPEADEDIFGDAGSYKPPSAEEIKARKKRSRWGEEIKPAHDEGDDVTGPYPADDDVTGPYPEHEEGEIVVGPYPADDDVIGPYPDTSGDAIGPYPDDDVTAPYPDAADYAMEQQYIQASEAYRNEPHALLPPGQQELTNEEKARGLASVFKWDDNALRREKVKDSKEKEANFIPDSYTECYPGAFEMTEYAYNSDDDEKDPFANMDTGKKSAIRRADFDDDDEFAAMKAQEEAMPKAAYQYGVKRSDGRQTRREKKGKVNDKAKLDREWNMINQIWNKRKAEGGKGGDSKKQRHDDDDEDDE